MAQQHEGIAWREWGEEAFAEARAQDKPVLLDIGAVWCHWCHVMDTGIPGDPDHPGTYNQTEVQRRIAEHFIPVKVDNDRRPDVNARYNMGGWPTTAFLTPDGDTLYGETYVPPARMVALLDYIHDVYQTSKDEVKAQATQMRAQRAEAARSAPAADLDPQTAPTVARSLKRHFDFAFGGFGTQPKFPHPDALLLALEQYARTGDAELREVAAKTLRGMAGGGMYDHFAGGFFRYSTTRDWNIPHFEKMLEDNARLTSVYALASQVLGDETYLDAVRSAHGWLLSDMRDPEMGTFAGSQDADGEEKYYGQPLAVRAMMPTPYIDRTVYAGWNALMVSSLVARYKITGEPDILDTAVQVFEFLVQHMGEDDPTTVGKGADGSILQYTILRHFYVDGRAQGSVGLLSDQTDFIAAALDLYEATGNVYYNYCANEAAAFILDFLEDKESGGFFDMPAQATGIGELAHPKKDMAENADTALALLRLSQCGFADEPRLRAAAERALRLFVGDYAQAGYFASSYARAVEAARLCTWSSWAHPTTPAPGPGVRPPGRPSPPARPSRLWASAKRRTVATPPARKAPPAPTSASGPCATSPARPRNSPRCCRQSGTHRTDEPSTPRRRVGTRAQRPCPLGFAAPPEPRPHFGLLPSADARELTAARYGRAVTYSPSIV